MKNNKKRGFTLVELLVVIAILAILATVAVVGYTSFITRARVSNDEEVANQMNDYWTALRADSMGDYYGEDITQDNVWEITQVILNSTGLGGQFIPQSLNDGYHLYFKFNEDGINGEYVVKKQSELYSSQGSLTMRILAALGVYAAPVNPEFDMPGIFYDATNIKYFLADTHGSPEAEAVRGFYTLDLFDGDLDAFFNAVDALDSKFNDLKVKKSNGIFVTKDQGSVGSNGYFLFVYEGAEFVPNVGITIGRNETTIYIPSSVQGLSKDNISVTDQGFTYQIVYSGFVQPGGSLIEAIKPGNNQGSGDSGSDDSENPGDTPAMDFSVGSFVISCPDVQNNEGKTKVHAIGTDVYLAYDYKSGSLTLIPTNFKGVDGKPYESDSVIWSVSGDADAEDGIVENAYVKVEDGVVTIKGAVEEDVTITATAEAGGYAVSVTLKAVKVDGVTYSFDGVDMSLINSTTIFYGTSSNEDNKFALSNISISYNHTVTGLDVDDDVVIELSADSLFQLYEDKQSLKVADVENGIGTETVTIAVGNDYEEPLTLTLCNKNELNFVEKNTNTPYSDGDKIIYVGEDNVVYASDLFSKQGEVPANAQIWVIKALPDTNYTNMLNAAASPHISAWQTNISTTSWGETAIRFNQNNENELREAIVVVVAPDGNGDYYRISENIKVSVVNGHNVRSATEEGVEWKSGTQSYVLLSKVSLWEGGDKTNSANYIKIGSNQKLWGNLFELNIKNGYYKANDASAGIIGLWGTISDTKIVGDVYTGFGISVGDNYGASAIDSKSASAQLINSYVSGCRSPLRLDNSITVTDCVFFGGRYANIDMVGEFTLTLNGTNYTVNQGYGNAAGVGIAAWFNNNTKTIVNNGTLKQYNFVDKTDKSLLPSINYVVVEVDIGDLFDQIMNSSEYNHMKFYTSTDTAKTNPYVHAGIVCLDYGATGSVSLTGINDYVNGEKTIELCGSLVWGIFKAADSTTRGISDRKMPNKVWCPNPTVYNDLFVESQNSAYMDTFTPEKFVMKPQQEQ